MAERRTRRSFTREFKAQAVKRLEEEVEIFRRATAFFAGGQPQSG